MGEGWSDPEERLLARSLFGTDALPAVRRLLGDWALAQGFGPAQVTAIELSVGAGVTLGLRDQGRIFVKVWPGQGDRDALAAQMALQQAMADGGFPAPRVLTKLSALGPGWAVAMACDRSGEATDVRQPGVRQAMAAGLARLVREAEPFRDRGGLPRRALPAEGAIWPPPHSALFDFEETREGAAWIDALAARALAVLRGAQGRLVVGHCDWSAKNMRMRGRALAVVYDWDSVFLERETLVLGSAAAHFPVTWELPVPETPAPEEVAAFVEDYAQARGQAFTRTELNEIAAGATYARAYKARCEHALDPGGVRWPGSSRESLKARGPFRF